MMGKQQGEGLLLGGTAALVPSQHAYGRRMKMDLYRCALNLLSDTISSHFILSLF